MLRRKYIFLFGITVLLLIGSVYFLKNKDDMYIDYVLKQKAYTYLPDEAKDYIREVYKQTGDVILTEKNKQDNKLYLNPEYVEYLTYTEEEKNNTGEIPATMVVDYSTTEQSDAINIPNKYDLRNVSGNNYVTPVRDQGKLGICWTFATAGAVESHLLKKNNTPYTSTSTLISERQIDYATSRDGLSDYKSEYVSFVDRSLGSGGNFYISSIAIANGISLFDYNSFKEYNDKDMSKMELSDVLSYNKSKYEVNSTINFPRLSLRDSTSILTDEEKEKRTSFLNEVKQNIIENGAAYVGTYMDSSCQYTDSNLNNTVIDVYNCQVAGGHAMEIIGWDDDLEYSYCADTKQHKATTSSCNRIVSGKGVWILKNSWGNSIQYPYLTYDSMYTSIHFIDELEIKDNKDWDNNYVLGDEYENTKSKTYNLSDTKINNDEKLKKVKFIAETPNTKYNVKVYKKDGSSETFSKTSKLPGLITVDIEKDIVVNKNSKIDISADNGFIDKIIVLTSNVDSTPYINLDEYNNTTISEDNIRLYSETKNIPSGTTVIYKIYNSNNVDVSNNVSVTNNIVAENNINTLLNFSNMTESGTYRIDTLYNTQIISSININVAKMAGAGTKNNPYIITNPTQLNQIKNDLDGYYELANDIDLTKDTHEGGKLSLKSNDCPQGFGWESINGFTGTLNGKGHTIKGLYQNNYITCNEEKWAEWTNNGNGLFGTANGDITIENLILEDFDINCQGGYCGLLVSKYDNRNQEENTATFRNIAVKNSKVSGITNDHNNRSDLQNSYGGGLFGSFLLANGNLILSNIYLDIQLIPDGFTNSSYLFDYLQAHNAIIQNIHLMGDITGKDSSGESNSILIHSLFAYDPTSVKNIVSTVTASNVGGNLFGKTNGDSLTINGANILEVPNQPLCKNNSSTCSSATNVNIYNKDSQLVELTKKANYDSWDNFDSNWVIKTVDGIARIPVLKFMDFEYTSVSDIVINQKVNEKVSIYDYLTPKIDAAKRITYKSNDEDIVKIDEEGIIIPQATGKTTIHIESLYDGYIKDVPISITYVPHYTINFDANGGTGKMESVEVNAGNNYTLPENNFIKENYEFNGWNTEADGTGERYSDLGQIEGMNDKETITLYAQWIGEERVVTFDANGGTVTPDKKIVHYGDTYGDLPLPTRNGYAFTYWYSNDVVVNSNTKIRGYTLTASWRNNAYTILYDANNGKISSDFSGNSDIRLLADTKVTSVATNNTDKKLATNIFQRDGYKFKEWNTKADGSGTSYSEQQVINMNNPEDNLLILYAIWEEDTGLKYDYNEDGIIDLLDVKQLFRIYMVTVDRENEEFVSKHDINGDGIVDLLDVKQFFRLVMLGTYD